MNTDNDYDEDGNNIVPCPICLNVYCEGKEEGGKCPEEDEFAKATTTPETMRGRFEKEFAGKPLGMWLFFQTGEYANLKKFFDAEDAHHKALRAKELGVTEDTSDGYHTFKELYEFRKVYNAVLFSEWVKQGKYDVHKSKKHHDGEDCFGGGWFIVMAQLPSGQISNHYEMKDWDLFQCEEREKANEWDGHTAQDVVKRLLDELIEKPTK